MTIFGLIWLILIVFCFSTSIENMIVLTIISATIQCSNVLVIDGSGIGPQILTSFACIIKICLIYTDLKINIYTQKAKIIFGVMILLLIILLSSVYNSTLSQNYLRVMQIYIYGLCFVLMFCAGKFISENFIYQLIRKLTIAILLIGVLQICITTGLLPRFTFVQELIYNDKTSNVIYFTRDNYFRILSTYMEPSYFAGFAVGSFYYFLSYKDKREENIILMVALLVEILLTFSSSAYVALVIGGVLFVASSKEKRLKIILILLALAGLMIFYIFFYDVLDLVIFSKTTSGSGVARRGWNIVAMRKFHTSPMLGVGYKMSRGSSIIYTILSEIGVLGLCSYIVLNLTVFLPILNEKKRISCMQMGLRFALVSVVLTQIVAVPDLDICTYWMWMNLLALSISSEHETVMRRKN